MPPHHIFSLDGVSLDNGFLDVVVGTGDALPGFHFLFLPLSHAVCQEVKLDCNTAHALFDLPTSGGRCTHILSVPLIQLQETL